MDVLGIAKHTLLEKDSNIGSVQLARGGVAANIAHQLANLGANAYILSVFGKDIFSDFLMQECLRQGIRTDFCIQLNAQSPVYMAIHDEKGEMRLAINDTHALDNIPLDLLKEKLLMTKDFDCAVLDCNLPENALQTVAQNTNLPLIADSVSVAKSERLKSILYKLHAIKPNKMEALALTNSKNVEDAAKALIDFGVKQVYISLGEDGLYFRDSSVFGKLPAQKVTLRHVTGAGDAMVAGLALGIAQKLPIEQIAALGVQSAAKQLSNTASSIL